MRTFRFLAGTIAAVALAHAAPEHAHKHKAAAPATPVPPYAGSGVEIPHAAQPQLFAAADGRVWLAYGRGTEVLVACSADGGTTFGAAVKAAEIPTLMLGRRRGPRIAAHGDRVTITAIGREAGDLLAFHSTDRGGTWSEPITINSVPKSAREGLHDLAVSADGRAFVTWLDLRAGKMELYGAESRDAGRTWGANQAIYISPDKSICECCHPNALYDEAGNLAVMWRNSIGGFRDMWLTTRPVGAKSFVAAAKLGTGAWELKGCPMDGGELIARGAGRYDSVWQRAGDVFFSPANGPETKLGKGTQPVALATGQETIVVWQNGATLWSSRPPTAAEPAKRADHGAFPVLVSVPKHARALLAFERGTSVIVERL